MVTSSKDDHDRRVRLISWNVAARNAWREQLTAIRLRGADIVAFQEVTEITAQRFESEFKEIDLNHHASSFADPEALRGPRRTGQFVASRWPLVRLPVSRALPWPECLLSVLIATPYGPIAVNNVHIPNGSNNGLVKVETLEGLYRELAKVTMTHRILCGDLNTPQAETTNGEIITWGQRLSQDGTVAAPRGEDRRWDASERNILSGLGQFDLVDTYRRLHGYAARDFSWYLSRKGKTIGRRFDHVFASISLNATECRYLHRFREEGLSDHSPIEVDFEPRERDF